MGMQIGGATTTGKVGNKVYGVGGTIRRLRVAKNSKSIQQVGSRSRLSLLSTQYRGLTAAQQDAWKQAALNYSRTNRAGIAKTLTGSQLFVEVNGLALTLKERLGDENSMTTTPPVPKTVSTTQMISSTASLIASFSGTIAADEKLVIYASRGQSTGTRRSTSPKLIARLLTADITVVVGPPATYTNNLSTEYAAVFGVPQAGLRIFLECYIVNEDEMVKRPAGSAFLTTV